MLGSGRSEILMSFPALYEPQNVKIFARLRRDLSLHFAPQARKFEVLRLLDAVFPLENEQRDPKTPKFSGRRRRPDPKIVQILDLRAPDFLPRGGKIAKGG